MKLADIEGRRVYLAGLGREGLATLEALRRFPPAQIAIADRNADIASQLPDWAKQARIYAPDPEMTNAADYEVVIRSPGVRPSLPGIRCAAKAGCLMTTPTKLWFAEAAGCKVVGVTGTKGKSTTATLLHRCLKSVGRNAYLLGNIGRPALELLPAAAGLYSVFILELSSFQLWDLDRSPQMAIILNLFTDHLDWHPDRRDYVQAKLNIARYQSQADQLIHHGTEVGIANEELPGKGARVPYCVSDGVHYRDGWFYHKTRKLFSTDTVKLPGKANLDNVCAVLAALIGLNVDPLAVIDAIAGFEGLPHRLQDVGDYSGLRFIDDSIATGPDAAIHSMDTFAGQPKVVLVGGNDKGIPGNKLLERLIKPDIAGIVLMQQSGRKIEAELSKLSNAPPFIYAESMVEAVGEAVVMVPKQGLVLLAPGAASAPPYKDYADRGEQFKLAIRKLSKPVD